MIRKCATFEAWHIEIDAIMFDCHACKSATSFDSKKYTELNDYGGESSKMLKIQIIMTDWWKHLGMIRYCENHHTNLKNNCNMKASNKQPIEAYHPH